MRFLRTTSLLAIVPLTALFLFIPSTPSAAQTVNDDVVDRSIRPGDDFYQYANGNWLAKVNLAPGQSSFDTRIELREKTAHRVSDLIQDAAASHSAQGSVRQKVGDYYASFMDEERIESKKLTPLADELAQISAITNKTSLSAYLGSTLNSEVDELTANADHIFGLWINQGFADTDHNVVHLWQGGLGLPDRDHYLDPSQKMADLRSHYQAHIAAVLKLAGVTDADPKAAGMLALETKIAQAFAPDSEAADVFKQNNPWKRADFSVKAPGLDWDAYFKSAGLGDQTNFLVWQPSAVTGVSALVEKESTDLWKDYLRFHLIEHYADVLPKAVRDERFAFYGTILSGAQSPPDRSKLAISATNGALGQAVGQLYTQRYFPPEAKARAQAMAADLITAFRARISNLKWMSAPTQEKALAKLSAFEILIGYPDTWIDYSTLKIVRGDALGNMRRAEAFLRSRNLAKLKQPVDPIEWPMNVQVPGAVIMFSPNAEFFSAAILQPPYFDPKGDSASNYGSAGAGMAHEISHSFDELGNIYDAHGRLGSWWTPEDLDAYHAEAAKMAAQFDAYCPLADLCLKGKQLLTENIADLAGLLVAHDAYILSLKGKPDVSIGGLTGEQRFFLAFAHRWRKLQDESGLRQQIATDSHSPGKYRSATVRNLDEWYKAFDIKPGDKLYLKPEDRDPNLVTPMRIAFVEWPEALSTVDAQWDELKERVDAARPDLLVTNELPFGPWLADNAFFSENEAHLSIRAHEQGLAALIDLALPAIISSRPVWNGRRLANEAFVLEKGAVRPLHRKQYFPNEPGWFEHEWYARDDSGFSVAEILGIKVGVLLCTEAMFNERARAYGRERASLLVIPRATGMDRESWQIAGAMASVVSGAYVVSSNRVGRSRSGTRFGGGGFAYAPHGRFIAVTTPANPVLTLELDPEISAAARREYPCYVPELE